MNIFGLFFVHIHIPTVSAVPTLLFTFIHLFVYISGIWSKSDSAILEKPVMPTKSTFHEYIG